MEKITAEQVKQAMIETGKTRVDHHECGGCGFMVSYVREGEQLYFDGSCDCTRHYSPPALRTWAEAADWTNMQSNEDTRNRLAASFGLAV